MYGCMLFLMPMIVLLHFRIDVNQNEVPYLGTFFGGAAIQLSHVSNRRISFVFRRSLAISRKSCSQNCVSYLSSEMWTMFRGHHGHSTREHLCLEFFPSRVIRLIFLIFLLNKLKARVFVY